MALVSTVPASFAPGAGAWTLSGGAAANAVDPTRLEIPNTGGVATTTVGYDVTNVSFVWRFGQIPVGCTVAVEWRNAAGTQVLRLECVTTPIFASMKWDLKLNGLSKATFNRSIANEEVWFRFRSITASTSVRLETSPDNTTYTNRAAATVTGFPLTGIFCRIEVTAPTADITSNPYDVLHVKQVSGAAAPDCHEVQAWPDTVTPTVGEWTGSAAGLQFLDGGGYGSFDSTGETISGLPATSKLTGYDFSAIPAGAGSVSITTRSYVTVTAVNAARWERVRVMNGASTVAGDTGQKAMGSRGSANALIPFRVPASGVSVAQIRTPGQVWVQLDQLMNSAASANYDILRLVATWGAAATGTVIRTKGGVATTVRMKS